jgi:ABC-type multidrug transport system permease subunit
MGKAVLPMPVSLAGFAGGPNCSVDHPMGVGGLWFHRWILDATDSDVDAEVDINPVTHLVTASRGLMHGDAALASILWVLVTAAAITAVFAPLALYLYHQER